MSVSGAVVDYSYGMSLRDRMDHPVTFTFFASLAIIGMLSFLTWGFKAANLPGPAALTQHP